MTGVRRQGSLIGLDIGRRVRNRKPTNNLVKRRFVGDKDCSPNRDRAARRRDRRDVARIRRQGRKIGLDIGRRIRNRKPANDLIERCCIGGKRCSPNRDRTTRRRDRCNETGVRHQSRQIGLDIGRCVRNRESANDLVEHRSIGGKRSSPNGDRTARRRDRRNETGVRRQGSKISLDIGRCVRNRKPANNLIERGFIGDKQAAFPTMTLPLVAVIDVMWLASAARAARLAWTLAAVSEIANPPTILFSDDFIERQTVHHRRVIVPFVAVIDVI